MVSSKIEGIFKSDDDEKTPPSEKELKVTKWWRSGFGLRRDVTLGGGKEEEGGEGRWGWQEKEARSGGISEGEEEAGRESWLNDL